eukprot:TRINITY_DN26959_c0_g1_i1.p1 TRINITY_DN26959_c0_g1~~TRINITY_DN26959_c0_g1_i1.p1  ORF type:complete len:283 (-),score=47.53 TRINITY_DN26959_c0_g1_i1:1025-1873(-)
MLSRSLLRKGSAAGRQISSTFCRDTVPLGVARSSALAYGGRDGNSTSMVLAPTCDEDRKKRMYMPLGVISRGFSADAAVAPVPPPPTPPTVVAWKNPSNRITYDEHNHERFPVGDPSKRAFTYLVLTGGRFVYATALRLLLLKLILSMSASKDVLALASLEVDTASIEPGRTVTVKWRGKPVFIRHRTEADVEKANQVNLKELRDPQEDSERASNPEWLVVVGVCTHLGCVPLPNAGDYGGWYCPCHGSHYDISGRARKGPAPYNLEVPPYKFLDATKLLIG